MSPIETDRSWTHFRVDHRNPRYCHVTFDEFISAREAKSGIASRRLQKPMSEHRK